MIEMQKLYIFNINKLMNLERNILFKAITTIYAVNISITSEFPLTIFIILIFF